MSLNAALAVARIALVATSLAACAAAQTPRPASPTETQRPPTAAAPVFANGIAQSVSAFQDSNVWIRQNLWVQTDFDTDRDGRNDRVHVDVTRPAQTDSGVQVPIVYASSPYFAGVAQTFAFWDVRQELGAEPPTRGKMSGPAYQSNRTRISNSLVNTFVPRGFAVVHSEASGTGRSQGCPTVGDYPERAAMKFVIDWLNGRAKGYTAPTGGREVSATSWSTGKVGMIGTSYEGTLPLAAAITGVDGLEVVIPVSPNTSYYNYYRANGLVRSPGGYLGEDVDVLYDFVASGDTAGGARANCDRIWKDGIFAQGQDRRTGDYNDFWEARDLAQQLEDVDAAVLLAHGLNDWNVMPSHSVRVYEEMKRLGKPVSMFLHQYGHGGNPPLDMVLRWFTHYLYGVENGVGSDPPVWIVETPPTPRPTRAEPRSFPSFPVPGSQMVTLYPSGDGNGVATLASSRGAQSRDTIVDDVAISGSRNAGVSQSRHRLLFATAPLRDTVRLSGTPRVTIRLASSKPAANLSVWIVTLPYDSTEVGSEGRVSVVTRGWADPQNHRSLVNGGYFTSEIPGEPLIPGRFYDLTFDLEPDHQVIPPGVRLAVMLMSSDREFTLWPASGTQLTVEAAGTSFLLPIVGGVEALRSAGAIQ
ncbi:MAG: Xaa-Pro dipeptidyl-peptidase [Gemmatimonadaceae bacterium]